MNDYQNTSSYYPSQSPHFQSAHSVPIISRQSTAVQPQPTSGQNSEQPSPLSFFSGPNLYHARRAAWLTPKPKGTSSAPNDSKLPTSTSSRNRITEVLSKEGAIESDETWNKGLKTLWRGLVTGSKLKQPLPLNVVIKVLHAGWIRDGTWPAGATMPDSDTELPPPASQEQAMVIDSGVTSRTETEPSTPSTYSLVSPTTPSQNDQDLVGDEADEEER